MKGLQFNAEKTQIMATGFGPDTYGEVDEFAEKFLEMEGDETSLLSEPTYIEETDTWLFDIIATN